MPSSSETADEPASLGMLLATDEITRVFTPLGLAGALAVSSFDELHKTRERGDMLMTTTGPKPLPSGMGGLLAWARGERLLIGQRSAASDEAMTDLRNDVAHQAGFHRIGPPEAARVVCRVAEFINRLWGADTPGGQVFPGPVERVPRVVAMSPDGRFVAFPNVRSVRAGDPAFDDGLFAVYLASPLEDLCGIGGRRLRFAHRPGFECTSLPCELLWGPGPRMKLLPTLDRYEDASLSDSVNHLDRLFIVCVDGELIDPARSPEDFLASAEANGEWHLIRADYPGDALRHVREHGTKTSKDLLDGRCPDCPVTELGRFSDRASATECLRRHNAS